jgi:tripartite-type tricarboxylate transporter receptor subunit TctC
MAPGGPFAALGFEPSGMSPAEFGATIKAEIAKWRKVIENGGIPKI